jgi:hypothetical protein
MASNYSPKIVTDGLILAIDAADKNCFVSGNTTCTNLITGGLLTGASGNPGSGTHTPNTGNFPAYSSLNGGIFNFSGGRGMNCEENLGTTTTSSICMWFYKNSSSTHYFTDGRNNGGDWLLSNYSSYNINWEAKLKFNYDGSYDASHSSFLNNWIYMVVTSDGTGGNLYLNGVEQTSETTTSSTDEDFGVNYRIGTRYTTSSQWTGYMGPINFYNKVLSSKEVSQNFNAHRHRFGV